jgi:hypothetical protein
MIKSFTNKNPHAPRADMGGFFLLEFAAVGLLLLLLFANIFVAFYPCATLISAMLFPPRATDGLVPAKFLNSPSILITASCHGAALVACDLCAAWSISAYRTALEADPARVRIAVAVSFVALRTVTWVLVYVVRARRDSQQTSRDWGADCTPFGTMPSVLHQARVDSRSRLAALPLDMVMCVLGPMLAGPGRFNWPRDSPGVEVIAVHRLAGGSMRRTFCSSRTATSR